MATTTPTAATAPKARAKAAPASKKSAASPAAKRAAVKPAKLEAEPKTLREEASSLFGQASEKVRKAADTGKAKATGAMDDVAAMAEDVAKTIDERLGTQYGDYARKAASAVSGIAEGLKSKEVEQLLHDARDFVRKKPAVAIGAAAAVGFLLTRLLKAGDNDDA
jgi:ElaB/YqjD/DUF883 family membrane-anchored ribosome-binding protein